MFDINEIKKDVLKSKTNAIFSHYVNGKLYYTIELSKGKYQFAINIVEPNPITLSFIEKGVRINKTIESIGLTTVTDDFGNSHLEKEMRGSLLNKWIEKAMNNNEFIPLFKELEEKIIEQN